MTENNETQNTHVRAVIEYQMVGDLPGKEWANLVLTHARNEGLIEHFAVHGTYPLYFAEVVDFTIDVPIQGFEAMDHEAAKEAIRPIAEKIVGESDVTVRYVHGVVVADPSAGAVFGEEYAVKVEYNTDFDGREIDPGKEEYPITLHGHFDTEEEAVDFMNAFMEDDTDVHDMTVVTINRVK